MLFDLVNLVPFVRKHKVNPVTGEAMVPSDIIRLNMAKNADGYSPHCNRGLKHYCSDLISMII